MAGNGYRAFSIYEHKLARVMERLGVEQYNFNWDRWGCYVEFRYGGELYRFEHSTEKARAKGIPLRSGSEAFVQVVLTLEDLARIVERGISDLATWVSGMRYLPEAVEVPEYFKALGFAQIPGSVEEVRQRYRQLVKERFPEEKPEDEGYRRLKEAAEQSLRHLNQRLS